MSFSSPLAVAPTLCRSGAHGAHGLSWATLRVAMLRRRRGLVATAPGFAMIAAASAFGAASMARAARRGAVRFPISCGWLSQRDFTAATSLLHSVQFADAEQVYGGIIRRDPDCATAYWGVAMSRLGNPINRPPDKADIAVARAALAGAPAPSEASPRERAYVAALGTLFADGVGHPERDTPERADAFAKTFDPRMLELSGSAGEVATVAKEYRIFFRKMPGADPADYLM